jgi:hypothetical protein
VKEKTTFTNNSIAEQRRRNWKGHLIGLVLTGFQRISYSINRKERGVQEGL